MLLWGHPQIVLDWCSEYWHGSALLPLKESSVSLIQEISKNVSYKFLSELVCVKVSCF